MYYLLYYWAGTVLCATHACHVFALGLTYDKELGAPKDVPRHKIERKQRRVILSKRVSGVAILFGGVVFRQVLPLNTCLNVFQNYCTYIVCEA
jgi:hypothetical protein